MEEEEVSITGRVYNIRSGSAKLYFIDLEGDSTKVQIFATLANFKGDFGVLKDIKRGDIIGIKGNPGRTNTMELSVRPTECQQLSYCLHMLPQREGDKNVLNKDTRYRQRYLDLIMNNPVK
jgi:lysyl-tRNA synthetase class 2